MPDLESTAFENAEPCVKIISMCHSSLKFIRMSSSLPEFSVNRYGRIANSRYSSGTGIDSMAKLETVVVFTAPSATPPFVFSRFSIVTSTDCEALTAFGLAALNRGMGKTFRECGDFVALYSRWEGLGTISFSSHRKMAGS